MSDDTLPLSTRLWFAWACLLRVLFDGAFARRAFDAVSEASDPHALPKLLPPTPDMDASREALALPHATVRGATEAGAPAANAVATGAAATGAIMPAPSGLGGNDGALALLSLLQREGRLVDFLQQDITAFADAEIGAAARVVHDGCASALRAHVALAPVRPEEEGHRVVLEAGFSPAEVRLMGNVQGVAPYRGVLVHRGWRASSVTLPTAVTGHDAAIVAPAEVEL